MNTEALRLDGPTIEEFIAAGYKAENYPPTGYAARASVPTPEVTPTPAPLAEPPVVQPPVDTTTPPAPPAPQKRFFHALNSSSFIHSDGLAFSFSPYLHAAGTWFGTFVTENADEIAALVKLVGKRIEEIDAKEYEACQKKKALTLQSLGQSLIHSEVSSDSRPSVNHAVPLNTEPEPPQLAAQPPIAGADALVLGDSKVPDATQ